ncbi:hypothetical protein FRC01_004249, partial [Tulasnella sp. 417]
MVPTKRALCTRAWKVQDILCVVSRFGTYGSYLSVMLLSVAYGVDGRLMSYERPAGSLPNNHEAVGIRAKNEALSNKVTWSAIDFGIGKASLGRIQLAEQMLNEEPF